MADAVLFVGSPKKAAELDGGVVTDGCPAELINTAIDDVFEPQRWFAAGSIVGAWGHRPS